MDTSRHGSHAEARRTTRTLPTIGGFLTRHEVAVLAALIIYGALVVVVSVQLLLLAPLLVVLWVLHAQPAPEVGFDPQPEDWAGESASPPIDHTSKRPETRPQITAALAPGLAPSAAATAMVAGQGQTLPGGVSRNG